MRQFGSYFILSVHSTPPPPSECLDDIEAAAMFKFPRELAYKLLDRKARSLLELGSAAEAVDAFDEALEAVGASNLKEDKKNSLVSGKWVRNCLISHVIWSRLSVRSRVTCCSLNESGQLVPNESKRTTRKLLFADRKFYAEWPSAERNELHMQACNHFSEPNYPN